MAFKTRKFSSSLEMDTHLNGGIICGNKKAAQGIEGLVGLDLTFTAPAGSVTFTQVAGRDNPDKLLIGDIIDQIGAVGALADLVVFAVDGAVAFKRATDGEVVTLAAAAEDSRVLLGLAKSGAVTGIYYNPDTTVPYVCNISLNQGAWCVVTVE